MPSPEFSPVHIVEVGAIKNIGGAKIEVKSKYKGPIQIPEARGTHKHEAGHGAGARIMGTPVDYITIEPGPGYRGLAKLGKRNDVAAAIPHVMGEGGTSSDIKSISGDKTAVFNDARRIAINNKDEINAVANKLREKRTLYGSEIDSIMNKVKKDKEEAEENKLKAKVIITDANGGRKEMDNVNAVGGKVDISEWKPLIPEKAQEKESAIQPLTPEGPTTRSGDLVPGKWTPIPGKPKIAG